MERYSGRQRLKEIVETRNTPSGKAFDAVIQILILFSVASFSIETLPDLSPQVRKVLGIAEAVTVGVFT